MSHVVCWNDGRRAHYMLASFANTQKRISNVTQRIKRLLRAFGYQPAKCPHHDERQGTGSTLRERVRPDDPQGTNGGLSASVYKLIHQLLAQYRSVFRGQSVPTWIPLLPTQFSSRPLAHTHITSHHNAINSQLEECRNLRPGPAKS